LRKRTDFSTLRFVAGGSEPKAPVLGCRFYRTQTGNEPVREWLKSLPAELRKEIGSDVEQVQWRWPVGKPLVEGFGRGLFEVRTSSDGNIYRVLFCLDGSTMVLLHGFKKKSRRTPKPDLDLARKRQKEVEQGS
jgi:phage-related protein